MDSSNNTGRTITTIFVVLSYEIWVYFAYVFLPIAYVSVFCYLQYKKTKVTTALKNNSNYITSLHGRYVGCISCKVGANTVFTWKIKGAIE